MMHKPAMQLLTTTLWEYPSQDYGRETHGDKDYVGGDAGVGDLAVAAALHAGGGHDFGSDVRERDDNGCGE